MEIEEKEKLNEVEEGENPVDTQTTTNSEPVDTEEYENPDEPVETAESEVDATELEEKSEPTFEQPEPRMFTQEEVNKLVGNARNEGRQSALNELVKTYGMEKIEDLGDIVGKSQQFDYINDEFNKANDELGAYRTKEILSNAKINPSKFDDVKFYMKGKGVDITPQSILEEIGTHPEWASQVSPANETSPNSNPINQKIEEVRKQFSEPIKKSFVTSSANETTSGNPNARQSEEEELEEVREWFNARK